MLQFSTSLYQSHGNLFIAATMSGIVGGLPLSKLNALTDVLYQFKSTYSQLTGQYLKELFTQAPYTVLTQEEKTRFINGVLGYLFSFINYLLFTRYLVQSNSDCFAS